DKLKRGYKMEVKDMNEKEIKVVEKATIYDIQRLFKQKERRQENSKYTTEEIIQILDEIVEAKEQE
ncbi:MAG: hypothetical protein NC485_15095, partial [Ruminococcus flavefaciens]|nr:hypothetical protein [Ruminococcus flavefaciens]